MKKSIFILSALALAGIFAVSCGEKTDKKTNFNEVMEDGFYVAGPATGAEKINADYAMASGVNEAADQTTRDGMFEKYIVLEKGKDFELLYYAAGKETRYSAKLADYTIDPASSEAYADNPSITILKGSLEIGDTAPAMQVDSTGLYHIVLDLNKTGDLDNAGGQQIIVAPVTWGVRGAMNGWGVTNFEKGTPSNAGYTMTLTDQKVPANGEFKFAYAGAWKITLDDQGKVKANTNLGSGETEGTLAQGGGNIVLAKGGVYTISLSFKLAAGAVGNSFSYETTITEESSAPTTMYMIGNDFGGWDWASPKVVEMHQFNSQEGQFWAIRYMTTATEFKFSPEKAWGSDFATPKSGDMTVEGAFNANPDDKNSNLKVKSDGLYTINVDAVGGRVIVEPAVIVGMDAPFGNSGWDINFADAEFTVDAAGIATYVLKADGEQLRTAVRSSMATEWWHAEFIIKDGAIVYRGTGGDPEKIAVTAGQKVTYDFNNETGSIE